jgi:hypothetical protein
MVGSAIRELPDSQGSWRKHGAVRVIMGKPERPGEREANKSNFRSLDALRILRR